jgi:hypothetical protein
VGQYFNGSYLNIQHLAAYKTDHPRVGAIRANGFDAHWLIELRPRNYLSRYDFAFVFHAFFYFV